MSTQRRYGLSLGLDIGGSKTHGLVLDPADQVLAEVIQPTVTGPEGVRATALDVSHALADLLHLPMTAFSSVGIGIPGIVGYRNGLVETAVNLGIVRTDLGGLLATGFTAPVRVENDVKATALGATVALGAPQRDLSYVNLGTGVSAAVVTHGRLLRGDRNGAGEIGHLVLDPNGDLCACGQRGCLETLVGGRYLSDRLATFERGDFNPVNSGPDNSDPDNSDPDNSDLGTPDGNTDPAASGAARRVIDALATALTLVVLSYDSAVVALGGGVPKAHGWLLPAVRSELEQRAAGSSFLTGLHVAERLVALPPEVPVAAIGAAVVGRETGPLAPSENLVGSQP